MEMSEETLNQKDWGRSKLCESCPMTTERMTRRSPGKSRIRLYLNLWEDRSGKLGRDIRALHYKYEIGDLGEAVWVERENSG